MPDGFLSDDNVVAIIPEGEQGYFIQPLIANPDLQKRFVESGGAEAVGMTPAEFLARIKADAQRYKRVVDKAGVKPG